MVSSKPKSAAHASANAAIIDVHKAKAPPGESGALLVEAEGGASRFIK